MRATTSVDAPALSPNPSPARGRGEEHTLTANPQGH
ncbi:protein of unknown function [Cupriavidus taiwanensis]|nr:protein of unknown function [Cupriavidus taiwanensis]